MSTSHRWRILSILILVVVIVASVSSYLVLNKPLGPSSFTSTSATLYSTQTSPASTSITIAPIQWITVGQTKSVDYYLSLLESNGTDPYVQLGKELRKLPEFEPYVQFANSTAVAEITYLALNATNPEVKEALKLMIKGGTPDPSDFTFAVPNYNTELQVLYWLACGNEFKKDDTLALAVAMANGLWITMGDQQVRDAVRNDTNAILTFLRETDALQEQRGYFELENYPLEAKIALAWTGNESPAGFGETRPHRLFDYKNKTLAINGYRWNTVEVETLRRMRGMMIQNGWVTSNVDQTVANLEYYFYFDLGITRSSHWNYTNPVRPGAKEEYIVIDGEKVLNHGYQNVDFMFGYYLEHNMVMGSCLDEEAFIDSWAKSWGIAATGLWLNPKSEGEYGHNFVVYYEPQSRSWRAYQGQLNVVQVDCFVYIYKIPVIQKRFLWTGVLKENPNRWDGGMVYIVKNLSITEFRSVFLKGLDASQMKQWLLYS